MLNKFEKFLREDGWLIFLLLILNSTPIIMAFSHTEDILFKSLLIDGVIEFYFGAFLILIFCAAVNFGLKKFPRVKFFLQILILLGFSISFVIDIFLIQTFGITLHTHFIEIALGTNPATFKEFLLNYILNFKIILIIVLVILILRAMIIKFREWQNKFSDETLQKISRHTLIICLPAVLILIFGSSDFILAAALNGTIFYRNLDNSYTAVKNYGSEPEIIAEMKKPHEKIIFDNSKIPYVILVLGESETRNHMQLYGYNLETTPLAVERYGRGEIFKFNDVIACANDTSAAMKLIFTFAEKDTDSENWYKAGNIFDIVRRAGYRTVWISNQSPVGWLGNLDKICAECCDEEYFNDVAKRNDKNIFSRDLDNVLLPVIDDFISRAHEKNFYCVHLYGSHPTYIERYPQNFSKFTAADEDKPDDLSKKITAEYDNAILYTDFILDEIFKRFEDKNALIIYISDHGEEVFEDGKNFAGHSPENLGNRSMIEIPMLVWTSKSFREMYPEKIAALKNSADNPYRTDLIIHTILDLMDIQTENFDAAKSIVNEKFDKNRPRIYNNKPYNKN